MDGVLSHRKAVREDLPAIVALLLDDELGSTRESGSATLDPRYPAAFARIEADPNQYLMVVELNGEIASTCHLTVMPSLTFAGSTRMQIEAVRVAAALRGEKIGEWMMRAALEYAKSHNARLVQLTTNKQRPRAKQFYERLGFEASHEGMKFLLD